jgi:carboxypeptidase Taq
MAHSQQDHYQKLLSISKRATVYSSIQSLLSWDQETYMPAEAIEFRAMQNEAMAGLVHQQKTSKEFAHALSQLIDLDTGEVLDDHASVAQRAALREWRRDYLQNSKLPDEFVQNWAKTTSQAIHVWQTSKKERDFALFAPSLTKIVELNRQKTDLLGYAEHPYDALLDLYEPDTKSSFIDTIFTRLKGPLQMQLKRIITSPSYQSGIEDAQLLKKKLPVDKQWKFAQKLLQGLGFQPQTSRLDQTAHPFCMRITPQDVRMTTTVLEDSFMTHVFAVLHEAGHGIYSEGLLKEEYGSPLGEDGSLGIHESQSRWWETRIGHTKAFWHYYYPELQADFPDPFQNISLDRFHHLINTVRPSLIRIYADEVTYNLHIILRFELEKALIEGKLSVKDVPEAWNAKMQEYLGITPQHDGEGCLQDIHWSMGSIGYFPTYALGNLYAAQFFRTFEQQYTDWQSQVSKGEVGFIRQWLKEQIHQYGRQYTPQEIIQRVTNQPLSEQPFLDYLEEKYTAIYPS